MILLLLVCSEMGKTFVSSRFMVLVRAPCDMQRLHGEWLDILRYDATDVCLEPLLQMC